MPSKRYEHGTLINGNCIDELSNIKDESVDLVFTSPPYFQGKDFDKSKLVNDFIENVTQCQNTLYPKLRVGASLCWQIGSHVQDRVTTPLDFFVFQICSQFPDLKLRNRVIWTFGHGEHAQTRLSGRYETILWYTKGDKYSFDLDEIRVPQKYPGKRHYRGPNRGQWSGNPLGKNPGDVWSIPNVKSNHVEKTDHPCQFPVALVSRFIRALTSAGRVILDPYAGSGSTAIAALETGRKFCCIEIDKTYFEIAARRVNNWYNGEEKVRPDLPVASPDPRTAVAERPPHFLEGPLT